MFELETPNNQTVEMKIGSAYWKLIGTPNPQGSIDKKLLAPPGVVNNELDPRGWDVLASVEEPFDIVHFHSW